MKAHTLQIELYSDTYMYIYSHCCEEDKMTVKVGKLDRGELSSCRKITDNSVHYCAGLIQTDV